MMTVRQRLECRTSINDKYVEVRVNDALHCPLFYAK